MVYFDFLAVRFLLGCCFVLVVCCCLLLFVVVFRVVWFCFWVCFGGFILGGSPAHHTAAAGRKNGF